MAAEHAFIDYWRRTRARLDAELPHWIRRFFDPLPASEQAAVYEALRGGKRLRGCLVCLVAEALGGTLEDALPRAVAVECIQAASLIHDDVVDGDEVRRQQPAMWATRGRRRAVLLGDLMFATVLCRMIELSRGDGIALGEAIASMASGAYQELLISPEPASAQPAQQLCEPDLYPLILHMKSGALFGAAARLGAHAAGSAPSVAGLAFGFGVQIGEAYQIGDDLEDLFDDDGRGHGGRLPLLVPLWRHFCEDLFGGAPPLIGESDEALGAWLADAHPLLRERMRDALNARLRAAASTAERLARGRHAELLRAAPAEIVRMMSG